jgi:hypothetical protein
MTERPAIVADIKTRPHWRVEIRPSSYEQFLIPDIDECLNAVKLAKVRLRGWDYPHLPNDRAFLTFGRHSVSAWVDFAAHKEYWTFFQSAQFVHLFAIKEAIAPNWERELRVNYEGVLRDREETTDIPGFIHIGNCLWTLTEIFEFAARLSERTIYRDKLEISITLKGIKGFALTTDLNRAWYGHYSATLDEIDHTWPLRAAELVAERDEVAVRAAVWIFKRFGWLEPNLEALREQQAELLNRAR